MERLSLSYSYDLEVYFFTIYYILLNKERFFPTELPT